MSQGKDDQAHQSDQETTDKRIRRSKQAVLTATYRLLSEAGIGGVSVDEVSRLSGVSKTTIYRHWPSRSALLLDACSKLGTKQEIPDTGSFKGDLTVLARQLARELGSARWPAVLPSIIDAAERDPEIAKLHATLHGGLMAPLLAVIERAKKKGHLPPGHQASETVAAIVAPFFYRRWFSREPIDERFIKSVVRTVVAGSKCT